MEKGENAGTLSHINFNFLNRIILSSANALNLVKSKILSFGKVLRGGIVSGQWSLKVVDCLIQMFSNTGLTFHQPGYVLSVINAFAKSIGPCQPVQSAQADMGRNFSLSLSFLHISKDNCTS